VLCLLCLTACAKNASEAGFNDTPDSGPPVVTEAGPEAAPEADAGDDTGSDANVTDAPPTPDAEAGTDGGIKYACVTQLSQSCVDISSCESTCLGQYQDGPSCTWYTQGGNPNVAQCNPAGTVSALFSCPAQLSTDCADAPVCESTCVGQVQGGNTCSVRSTGGVKSDVPCTQAKGAVALYLCPVVASNGCANTSVCQSTCVGQISTSAKCTHRGPGGVGTDASCTPIGTLSF
jgi:hypothetical protein